MQWNPLKMLTEDKNGANWQSVFKVVTEKKRMPSQASTPLNSDL